MGKYRNSSRAAVPGITPESGGRIGNRPEVMGRVSNADKLRALESGGEFIDQLADQERREHRDREG